MRKDLFDLLERGAAQIDQSLATDDVLSRLSRLFDEITLFNPTLGLVAADGQELVTRHILDCLAPVPVFRAELQPGALVADLGSGSGLPGIVLASAMPEFRFALVERMGRRAGFLRNTVAMCRLADRASVLQSDLSELKGSFDAVTFRAFRQMDGIATDINRILNPGGKVLSFKSSESNIAEEVSSMDRLLPGEFSHKAVPYAVPFLDASRTMLVSLKLN